MANNKTKILIFSLLLLGIWSWGLAAASWAVPMLVNVQGRLTDAAGNPIGTATTMKISIWDALSGGTLIWSRDYTGVDPDDNGIFNMIISGTSTNPMGASFPEFLTDSNYIEFGIYDTAWSTLSPRQRLVSVPYAITAKNLKGGMVDAGGTINTSTYYMIRGNKVLSNPATDNLFIGVYTGQANTTGQRNTFFGHNVGIYNTSGSDNTFIGRNAGRDNTNGRLNTFVGSSAGIDNTTGYGNTYMGYWAGAINKASAYNTFIGYQAGMTNEASYNTFIGCEAGKANTSGLYNTFFGRQAGYINTSGSSNTYFGQMAGSGNLIGSYNTFLGHMTGRYNKGSSNVFIGSNAGNDPIFNDISNKLIIDNSNTSSPLIYGDFSANFLRINGNLGVGAEPSSISPYRLTLPNDTTAGSNGGKGIAYAWATYSSIRWKENLQPIGNPLNKVDQLSGVYFDWKANKKHDLGMIAEEVGKTIPEVVSYEDNGKDASGLDYGRLVALLVEAVKEQQKDIKDLKREIAEFKAKR